MKVMKALFSFLFLLLLLAPLTLNSESTESVAHLEKGNSPVLAWIQAAPTHDEILTEIEIETEENDTSSSDFIVFLNPLLNFATAYLNPFYIQPSSLWSPLLQFCTRLTLSPPKS